MAFDLKGKSNASVTKRRSLGISRRKLIVPKDHCSGSGYHHIDSLSASTSPSPNHKISNPTITTLAHTDCNTCVNNNTPERTKLASPSESGIQGPVPCKNSQPRNLSTFKPSTATATSSFSTPRQHNRSAVPSYSASSAGCSTTPANRPRTGLHRSLRKRFKADFKPYIAIGAEKQVPCKADTDDERSVASLKEESLKLQEEINALRKEGFDEGELQIHMQKMHEYNELKDMGQMLLGKIAVFEGVTTKDLYERYGLDLDD